VQFLQVGRQPPTKFLFSPWGAGKGIGMVPSMARSTNGARTSSSGSRAHRLFAGGAHFYAAFDQMKRLVGIRAASSANAHALHR